MFVLRVGIDQVHKLFSHFTKNQVVGDLGRWRFWWWWHCWWCWWFWWWFGGADFGDDDDQVMGLGSSGWWWLSPGDGSSGWPVGVLPVHDLWLWTSPPGKGFNTELCLINITRSHLTITYHWLLPQIQLVNRWSFCSSYCWQIQHSGWRPPGPLGLKSSLYAKLSWMGFL